MPILAIETSGLQGSIALLHDGVTCERPLATAGRRHAQTLTLEVQELLREQRLSPRDLTAVAVSLGPGSFTGLRVGVVCAKTLTYALGCPLIGIETYHALLAGLPTDLVTESTTEPPRRFWTIGDAQRGDLFLAEFVPQPTGDWVRLGEYQIVPGETWLAGLTERDVVLGPGVLRYQDVATAAMRVQEPACVQPAAKALIPLAESRLQGGQVDSPWTLAPIYLRPSAAEEQRAKRDAAG